MMNWCAYCQQFQGETPPFDDYKLTHGMCAACSARGMDLSDREFDQVLDLKKIQESLLNAGLSHDEPAADEAIAAALKFGARPVDVLMGLIAPALWQIGELWACGKISVADEHRFTKFYSVVIGRIEAAELARIKPVGASDILLVNAAGNIHTLGARFINLKLINEGICSRIMEGRPSLSALISEIESFKPKFLGISVATAEQVPAVMLLREGLIAHFSTLCPKILIGGNAVKQDMVPKVTGIIVGLNLADITSVVRAG